MVLRYSDNPSIGGHYGRPFRNKVSPLGYPTIEIFKVFKTPDSQDYVDKMKSFTSLGAFAGSIRGSFDYMSTKTTSPMLCLGRILFGTAQGVVYTGTYASTVYIASQLRGGADDTLNHFIGGLMVGQLVGAKAQSVGLGCIFAVVFGVVGALFKGSYTSTNPWAGLMTFSNQEYEDMPRRTMSGPWTRRRYWGVGEVERLSPAFGPHKRLKNEEVGGKWIPRA